MALRLHRVTDQEWQRLAAARRIQDLAGNPPRTAIGAIEAELRSLDPAPVADLGDYREAAAG